MPWPGSLGEPEATPGQPAWPPAALRSGDGGLYAALQGAVTIETVATSIVHHRMMEGGGWDRVDGEGTGRAEFKSGQRKRIDGCSDDESGLCEEASDAAGVTRWVLPAYHLCCGIEVS